MIATSIAPEIIANTYKEFGFAMGSVVLLVIFLSIAVVVLFFQSKEDRKNYNSRLESSYDDFVTAIKEMTGELKQVSMDVTFLKETEMFKQAVKKSE